MSEESRQAKVNATLICPQCGIKQKVIMPIDNFQHYFKCTNEQCLADLAPLPGKDCVFCSYANIPCPQKQLNPHADEHHLQSLI